MTNLIRLEISERTEFAGGHEFESAGAYERLVGRAHFSVDPTAPAQTDIVDIEHALRNGDGLVEFSADVFILTPTNPTKGNSRLFFGYGNRGNKRELQFLNDAPANNDPRSITDAGNGFLMRRGYSVVWAAWQGDLLPGSGRLLLDVPVATQNGGAITGLVRSEFIATKPGVMSFPLSSYPTSRSYATVSLDTTKAQLTRKRYALDEREPIDSSEWQFARIETGGGLETQGTQHAVVDSDRHIYLKNGFEPGWIYELVYTARDPLVLGLGHLAVRDLVSFLRYRDVDDGGKENPLAGRIEKAYGWGRSQTGRCIRDFVHRGFNADAQGRRVFDGVLPHVAGGGLMWMNHRFACPESAASQQYEDHFTCADRFPFAYSESTDHITGRRDAILKRPDTDPLVIHTQSATEYWQRRGSLAHTDTEGNDLPIPDNVRIYMFSSSQHFADPMMKAPPRGVCQQPCNVVRTSMLLRAMLDAMDAWASTGAAPTASRIPKRADGTLVSYDEWHNQFPQIPGAAIPQAPNELHAVDYGPEFDHGLLIEPPRVDTNAHYTILVPAVDADGNDVAGIRAPMVQAPLGTYTGWNLRARGYGHGAMHEFTGAYMAFSDSAAERKATGDPRRSVLERYEDVDDYVRRIELAARELVEARLLLEEDVERAVADAASWDRPRHSVAL